MSRSLTALALLVAVAAVPLVGAPPNDPLEFLKKLTRTADPGLVRELIRQLGDEAFEARQDAGRELVILGGLALAELRHAADADPDPEVRSRAAVCVLRITSESEAVPILRAIRACGQSPEAAAVLLGFAPQVAAPSARAAIIDALTALPDDELLIAALDDPQPARRVVAGTALGRNAGRDPPPRLRRLLDDPEPSVRLPIALALVKRQVGDAVPALISVLDKLPRTDLVEVEETLFRLADDASPPVPYGRTGDERRRFREAWEGWWAERGPNVDLGSPVSPYLDRTLIVLLDLNKVIDLDTDEKERFEIDGLNFPLDAQYLTGDRVLLAEHNGGRVTERHRSGVVLWEHDFDGPLVAQRLPNGNTYICGKTGMAEVDRDGSVLWGLPVTPGEEIMRAAKLSNGEVAVVIMDRQGGQQRFVRMDTLGRERKSFPVVVRTYGGRLDVQPDGRVLVPQHFLNTVIEFDSEGLAVREFRVGRPITAVRMPNGHTIITSMSENRAVEFDAAGKEIWQYSRDTRVTRCLRR